jgi:hypothetical protein
MDPEKRPGRDRRRHRVDAATVTTSGIIERERQDDEMHRATRRRPARREAQWLLRSVEVARLYVVAELVREPARDTKDRAASGGRPTPAQQHSGRHIRTAGRSAASGSHRHG